MKFLLPVFLLGALSSFADSPKLEDITQSELDNITKEFSANFSHRTVVPANSLGSIWGLEVGVVGGITESSDLDALVKRVDTSVDVENVYHAGGLVRVSVPYGVTFEGVFFPEKEISDLTIKSSSGAVMWTVTDEFLGGLLPFDYHFAVRAHYATAELSYKQTFSSVSNATGTITFDNKVWGLDAIFSAEFLFLEPYVGVGFLSADGTTTVDASVTVPFFDSSIGSTTSATSDPTSMRLIAGLQFDLWLLNIAAEVEQSFGTTSATGKLSFAF